jgi:hypothetical protein
LNDIYDKFLTSLLIKRTREFALKNLDKGSKWKESGNDFFARTYIESFLDALIAEDYEVTIKKDEVIIKLKKGQ